ncbi:DUF2163 domain-containing protein [Siculibacillus lacustris]|uniref:DUF2163 domain-containing protein n=1 Tax=Siculibacillus lacustris TaxID=1549641 RepID=A0A4Q9VYA5_9HYPH|nr:DUF2163 domain-containing protein [Siculibacillus lacustris]TBW40982.1 DUF2163 domain-containing protein [Siculibacillus lacustris]
MKTVAPELAATLAGGVTTLATCWRLILADGRVLGFTDHDRPLVFGGVTHEAATGFTASEAVARADLSVGGLEVDGALSSPTLTATDIEAGLFDAAAVEIDLVDWSDPSRRLRLRRGSLGEITRLDGAFRAEIRSLAHRLDETGGRLFQHRCDADLGDARCGVAPIARAGTVTRVIDRRRIAVAGLAGVAEGALDRGLLRVASGACAGLAVEVKVHRVDAGEVTLELWQTPSAALAVGDAVTVSEGCDKRFETCRDRFSNARAFRGFPHIPGNDFLVASPDAGMITDGGALVP